MRKKVSPTDRATDGLMNVRTNRWTDHEMDRPPNIIGYKEACKRFSKKLNIFLDFFEMFEPHDTVIFQWILFISHKRNKLVLKKAKIITRQLFIP